MRETHPKIHRTFQSRGHLANEKRYISTFTRSMAPERSKVVTQDEETTPTKTRDISITWSRTKIKKRFISVPELTG